MNFKVLKDEHLSLQVPDPVIELMDLLSATSCTGKNNRFPFLDILGYLKNTHKNPKFGRVRQIWDFYGYSLNTLKYPKIGIRYFFL